VSRLLRGIKMMKLKMLLFFISFFESAEQKLNPHTNIITVEDSLVLGDTVQDPRGCAEWKDREEDANC
jgi:hypothetical protein